MRAVAIRLSRLVKISSSCASSAVSYTHLDVYKRQVLLDSKRMLSPPRYPTGLMRAGVSGAVLLHLRLNPDGTVADVVASQSSLFDIKGSSSILDKARGLLEKESIRAARSWTWQVHAAHPELLTCLLYTSRCV